MKKVYKPLQLLGFMPITVAYQMLHCCNILTLLFINMLFLFQQNTLFKGFL